MFGSDFNRFGEKEDKKKEENKESQKQDQEGPEVTEDVAINPTIGKQPKQANTVNDQYTSSEIQKTPSSEDMGVEVDKAPNLPIDTQSNDEGKEDNKEEELSNNDKDATLDDSSERNEKAKPDSKTLDESKDEENIHPKAPVPNTDEDVSSDQ